jgi:replication factor A2
MADTDYDHVDGSQSPPKKLRAHQSLLPVTIKQINDATSNGSDDTTKIDGHDNQDLQITIVGMIREVQDAQLTHSRYTLDDGTGTIAVVDYFSREAPEIVQNKKAQRREGVYVRVYGKLLEYQPNQNNANNANSNYANQSKKRQIKAFRLVPIEDFNEITFHFLEVIQAHLYKNYGPAPYTLMSNSAPNSPQKSPLKSSNLLNSPNKGPGNSLQSRFQQNLQNYGTGNNQVANNPYQNSKPANGNGAPKPIPGGDLNGQIEHLLRQNKSRVEGMSLDEITSHLEGVATFSEVSKTLQKMLADAVIYDTLDDKHFALTD